MRLESQPALAGRIRAFDWLRGLAVLFMIQCHAFALLKPELRSGPLFQRLVWLDGLVAPAFIFSAGFSLALVQVRGARSGTRLRRLLKTLRRLGEVLAVAYLGTWMFFPIRAEPKWLLRVDILHCIGLALLVALPLTAGLATRPRALAGAALALGAGVFGVSPVAESLRGFASHIANTSSGSAFPLLPWAGYVYLGASAGAIAGSGEPRRLVRWLVALGVIAFATWQATPWLRDAYPPHEFWVTNPANHAQRLTIVVALVLGLLALERGVPGRWTATPPVRFVEVFGASSLAAYFFHETLLYYRIFGFSFHALWGEASGWWRYAGLTALLIGAAFVLAWSTDRVYRAAGNRIDAAMARLRGGPGGVPPAAGSIVQRAAPG